MVEAGNAGVETLQPVNGREAGFGVVEGQKLPVHRGPGRASGVLQEPVGGSLGIVHAGREVRLCGHVGQLAVDVAGEDQVVWISIT